MRIGLVCPYSLATPGGVQNHVLGLAGWLLGEGHRVQVLAPDRADPELLRRHGIPEAVVHSSGRSIPVPYNGSVARITWGPRTALRVRRWVAAGDFDVLHVHEPITPSAAILALGAARCPVVATFHTATPRSRTMHLARRLLAGMIERIDARIAVSETAARVVATHLRRDARIIPNGFSHDQLQASGVARSPHRLAFLGRLNEPRKGLDVLLQAWPLIRAAHPECELVLAGSGHRELPDGCRALGVLTDAERAELLAGAELFIAPHRGRESFGLVVVEAMAAGAIVVAADIPAFVDVLTGPDGRPYGHLFRAGNPRALAEAVLAALDEQAVSSANDELRAVATGAARRYDWSLVAPQIMGVYAEVAPARVETPRADESIASADWPGWVR
ncbi:glycosyltransferase family 4 protein [Propionibacteriaceae bacterium Y2011]|uniref:glycosyltransferase family 4 protein n=1 Tax=Microlunatus sp. Y2014 TaxID=3418488 RepID=UPI003B4B4A7C